VNTLLAQVRALSERAGAILNRAERAGDLRVALVAVREVRGGLELLAKLAGEFRGEKLAIPPAPASAAGARVLILLPDDGRSPGVTPVSLVDVVREYGLFSTRGPVVEHETGGEG
jgi:hypothetical protein